MRLCQFETRFVKSEGCWEWTGRRSASGYGRYGNGYAHRVAYELYVGQIPDGHQVDHLCRNRACVNPDHLEAVTQKVNIQRSMAPSAITARTNCCRLGHELTPENTYRRPDGTRECRMCKRARWLRWHAGTAAAAWDEGYNAGFDNGVSAAHETPTTPHDNPYRAHARLVDDSHVPLHQEDR